MREINFRAWNKALKTMLDVAAIDFRPSKPQIIADNFFYPLSDCEIMQSTGMIDTNGQKIYEGDVVEFQDSQFHVEGYCYTYFINRGVVEYEGGAFYFTNLQGSGMDDFTDENYWDCVVVGNIYENPELLGG